MTALQTFAERKQLPAEFLERHGLSVGNDRRINIAYGDGGRARIRRHPETANPTLWATGDTRPMRAYGHDLVQKMAIGSNKQLLLVEGESDSLTAWHHGWPALGVPGATMAHIIRREDAAWAQRVGILREPGDAGAKFVPSVAKRLRELGLNCEIVEVTLEPHKDLSDLHVSVGGDHQRFVGALQAAMGQSVPIEVSKRTSNGGLTFVRAGDLLTEKDEPLEYAVNGLLPLGGTGVLVGRPKGGKSTVAINLGLAVARGVPFLGRETQKGPVLYLALEGASRGWKAVLRSLGVTSDDDLFICIGRAPDSAIAWLHEEMQRRKPVLVIVDTMQRLLRVKDGNDYATGSNATDAVIELARLTNAALLLLHHSGKTRRTEIVDEVMGSTAWAAGVDSVLLVRRSESYRTIESDQRFGENMPETVLAMDPLTHAITADGVKRDVVRNTMRESITTFLREHAEAYPREPFADQPTIEKGIEGKTQAKRDALREAFKAGEIARVGEGKKGRPYLYTLPCFLVPLHIREQLRENPEIEENADGIKSDSCSHDPIEVPDEGSTVCGSRGDGSSPLGLGVDDGLPSTADVAELRLIVPFQTDFVPNVVEGAL